MNTMMQTCNENNHVFLENIMDDARDLLLSKLADYASVTLSLQDKEIDFYAKVPDELKQRYLDDQIEGLYIPDCGSEERIPFLAYANAGDLKLLNMSKSLTPAAKCAYANSLNQMAACIYLAYVADRAFESWLQSRNDFYDAAAEQYMKEQYEPDYDYDDR